MTRPYAWLVTRVKAVRNTEPRVRPCHNSFNLDTNTSTSTNTSIMKNVLVLSLIAAVVATTATTTARDIYDTSYSTRMINNVISRKQGLVSSGADTSILESGVLALAIQSWLSFYSKHYDAAHIVRFSGYVDSIVASISPSFTDPTVTATKPLDRLTIGQALLNIKATVGTLTKAQTDTLSTLDQSLIMQKRNQLHGFWYDVYPNWSYLDGAFSFLPYMAAAPGWSHEDMLTQIELLYRNTYDSKTKLLVHGYDASKTAVWANKVTGGSPYVWGRALGLYLGGLVNAWEKLGGCKGGSDAACVRLATTIQTQANELSNGIATYADAVAGVWWQLPTVGAKQLNFFESSSTMLYVFAILKGLRIGLLKESGVTANGLKAVARKAYNYAVTSYAFLVFNNDGTFNWEGTVETCSLNSSANFEYYVTKSLVPNDALGEGTFILASLEIEQA